jgi:hypothetical protein
MKKSIVTLLVLGLIFGSLIGSAEAKKKKKIKKPVKVTVEASGTYQTPTLGVIGACAQTDAQGCVAFGAPAADLSYISVNITDQSGLPVNASIQQETGVNEAGVPQDSLIQAFCGKTDAPVAIDPSLEVHIWVEDTPNPDCAPSAATTGTVDLTFSNMP